MRFSWSRIVAAASVIALTASGCGRDVLDPLLPSPSPSPTATPSPSPTPGNGQFAPVELQVTALSAPQTATVGQPVQVTATVLLPNACTSLSNVTAAVSGERQVTVRATGLEEQGVACAQVVTEVSATVTFTPDETGTYEVVAALGDATATVEVTE